jgi:hypothetical protein
MDKEIEDLKELVKEIDALNQIIGFEIGSLPRRMRDIAIRIIDKEELSKGHSCDHPDCKGYNGK